MAREEVRIGSRGMGGKSGVFNLQWGLGVEVLLVAKDTGKDEV